MSHNFYNKNSQQFFHDTFTVDMGAIYARFLKNLPEGCKILDMGCGSGRDAYYFHSKGFEVEAFDASHEMLWRQDGAYDIIVVLGYNDAPVRPHRGSAIFFHCLARGQTETAGCVAVQREEMLEILAMLPADAVMRIRA